MPDRDAAAGAGLIAALVRSGYKRFRYRTAVHRLVGSRPTEVQAIARAGRHGTPVPPVRRGRPAAPASTSVPDQANVLVGPAVRCAEPDSPASAAPRPSPRPLEVTHAVVQVRGTAEAAASTPHIAVTPPAHAAPWVAPAIRRSDVRAQRVAPPVVEISSTVTAGAPAADLAMSAPGHRPAVAYAAPTPPNAATVSSRVAPRASMPPPASSPDPASFTSAARFRAVAEGSSNPEPAHLATSPTSAAAVRVELLTAAPAHSLDAAHAQSPAQVTVDELVAPRAQAPLTGLARHGQAPRAIAEPHRTHVPATLDAPGHGNPVAPLAPRPTAPPRLASTDAKLHGRIFELAREVAALRQGQRETASRAVAPPPDPSPRPALQVRTRGVQPPSDARWARRYVGPLRFRVSR